MRSQTRGPDGCEICAEFEAWGAFGAQKQTTSLPWVSGRRNSTCEGRKERTWVSLCRVSRDGDEEEEGARS